MLEEVEAAPIRKPTAQVNDAVMVPRGKKSCDLCRVKAVTGDGRACVDNVGDWHEENGDYRVEDEPGQWPVVGRYSWRGLFFGGWVLEHNS